MINSFLEAQSTVCIARSTSLKKSLSIYKPTDVLALIFDLPMSYLLHLHIQLSRWETHHNSRYHLKAREFLPVFPSSNHPNKFQLFSRLYSFLLKIQMCANPCTRDIFREFWQTFCLNSIFLPKTKNPKRHCRSVFFGLGSFISAKSFIRLENRL